jgi:hypothetical protein
MVAVAIGASITAATVARRISTSVASGGGYWSRMTSSTMEIFTGSTGMAVEAKPYAASNDECIEMGRNSRSGLASTTKGVMKPHRLTRHSINMKKRRACRLLSSLFSSSGLVRGSMLTCLD